MSVELSNEEIVLRRARNALMDAEEELDRQIQALQDERHRLRRVFIMEHAPAQVGDIIEESGGRRLKVAAIEIGMISRTGGVDFSAVGPRVLKSGKLGDTIRIPYWRPWAKVGSA